MRFLDFWKIVVVYGVSSLVIEMDSCWFWFWFWKWMSLVSGVLGFFLLCCYGFGGGYVVRLRGLRWWGWWFEVDDGSGGGLDLTMVVERER